GCTYTMASRLPWEPGWPAVALIPDGFSVFSPDASLACSLSSLAACVRASPAFERLTVRRAQPTSRACTPRVPQPPLRLAPRCSKGKWACPFAPPCGIRHDSDRAWDFDAGPPQTLPYGFLPVQNDLGRLYR